MASSRSGQAVAPLISTFRGGKADERSLLEGLALPVELDGRPRLGLAALCAVCGPPTLLVAGAARRRVSATGEAQDKPRGR